MHCITNIRLATPQQPANCAIDHAGAVNRLVSPLRKPLGTSKPGAPLANRTWVHVSRKPLMNVGSELSRAPDLRQVGGTTRAAG